MAGYVLVGALAAFGLLSALWAAFGWLLPGGTGMAVVCYGCPDAAMLGRVRWLRGVGLLRCPMLAVAEEPGAAAPEIEMIRPEALSARLEWERNRKYGTGNGDPSGCHQRRDISEL